MIADTLIIDDRTGEVLADPGQALDDEQLYRLEMLALDPQPGPQSPPYCPRCGYELLDPDSHYQDPGSYALYCLLGARTPREQYAAITHQMQAEMAAGDISPVQWERRTAAAARAFMEEPWKEAMS